MSDLDSTLIEHKKVWKYERHRQHSQIITPIKEKPFQNVTNYKKKIAFILHLAKLPLRKIGQLLKVSHVTIWRWVKSRKKCNILYSRYIV